MGFFETMVGGSAAMQRVREQILCAATSHEPVLVTGERGTGKELVARSLHEKSAVRGGPLVVVDCATLSPTLADAELFGHERGAFTGATHQRKGRVEEADGGTLFLDEIGQLALPVQASLLRFLEYGTFRRVGGRQNLAVHPRIVAATNADLLAACAAGRFLPDLYDRLNVLRIHLPPLRDRREDLAQLARHFWQEERGGEEPLGPALLHRIQAEPLPGNVRELRNVVVRLAVATRYAHTAVPPATADDVAWAAEIWDTPAS